MCYLEMLAVQSKRHRLEKSHRQRAAVKQLKIKEEEAKRIADEEEEQRKAARKKNRLQDSVGEDFISVCSVRMLSKRGTPSTRSTNKDVIYRPPRSQVSSPRKDVNSTPQTPVHHNVQRDNNTLQEDGIKVSNTPNGVMRGVGLQPSMSLEDELSDSMNNSSFTESSGSTFTRKQRPDSPNKSPGGGSPSTDMMETSTLRSRSLSIIERVADFDM